MKYPVFKKFLAVITAAAVAVMPLAGTVYASKASETAEARDAVSVLETALASYDFDDYQTATDGNSLTDGTHVLALETRGSGTAPTLVDDPDTEYGRGQVLQLNSTSFANRGYALLPENPFEGRTVEDGFTLNFWTKTNGTQSDYKNKCLIDFEVYPATDENATADPDRAGTFAVNQAMIYWNTTSQNGNFMDFDTADLGLSTQGSWKMVTIALTTNGLAAYCDGKKIETPITASNATNYEKMISDLAGELLDEEDQKTNVRLGASLAAYWYGAKALLDDVSFYGKALTAAEVKTLYNETKVKVDLESITISGDTAVDAGKTIQLSAAFTPSNTTEKDLVWGSSDTNVLAVDEDGKVTGVGKGKATVTASVGDVTSNVIEITVNETVKSLVPGRYLTVYSTTTNFYTSGGLREQETRSVYMAVSTDGKNFEVLNNGGGVIFSKNSGGTLQITNPLVFRSEGGFTVVAPDATASKGIHLFTSTDGVHYYDDTLVPTTKLDALSLNKDNFTLMLNGKNILKTDLNITLGDAVELTEEEYTYIVNKLGTVTNNGLESLKDLSTDTKTGLTESKLAELYPNVNAAYTDGSVQKFNIDWSGALKNVDLTKSGTYTLTGKVIQTKYLNNLKELNGSILPEDDPDNENPDYPDNYNEATGTTYYDETKFVEGMADPCIYWDEQTGYYYMTGSYFPEEGDQIDENDNLQQYDRIILRRARTLEGLQDRSNQVTIWKVGNQGYYDKGNYVSSGQRYIWAPEIHRVGDNWVVYFTESHLGGDEFNIYCHSLVLSGNLDPYETALEASDQVSEWTDYRVTKGSDVTDPVDSLNNRFCLDMTYFKDEVNDQSYVIWAGTPTASYQGGSTDIFIATVDEEQPWVVTSAATRLTCSDYGWERIRYCVNEGATVLQKDGNIYMCYSASGTGSEYAIGMCSAKGGADLLDIGQWTKSPYPLLTSRDVDGEEGPGHNSFTVDKDGNAIFVYHARPTSHNYEKCGSDKDGNKGPYNSEPLNDPCRHARLKRVHWAADGTPILKMTYDDELLDEYSTVSLKVTVKAVDIPVEDKVTLDKSKVSLSVGGTVTLKATATGKVTYKSSNVKVATVSSAGKVTALKTGNATITAVCGKATAVCEVTVKKDSIKVNSVKVGKKSVKASKKTITATKGKKVIIHIKKTNTLNKIKVKVSNTKAVKVVTVKNTTNKSIITLNVKKAVKKKVKVTISCGSRIITRHIKTK